MVHTSHSTTTQHDFVDEEFGSHTLERLKAAQEFMKTANGDTTKDEAYKFAKTKPVWKGRGGMVGTVTSTHFRVNGKKVDMYMRTDDEHIEVHIKNY